MIYKSSKCLEQWWPLFWLSPNIAGTLSDFAEHGGLHSFKSTIESALVESNIWATEYFFMLICIF